MDYDPIAKHFRNYTKTAFTEWSLGYPKVAEILEPLAGKKILDFGSGSGDFSRYLKEKGADVLGVDQSQEMINLANEKGDIIYKKVDDDLSILGEEKFDGVTANFVFCIYNNEEKILNSFKEIKRVLKKDGILVILHSNWDRSNGNEFISFRLNKKEGLKSGDQIIATLKGEKELEVHDYFRSQEEYKFLLQKAGFEKVDILEIKAKDEKEQWLDEKEHSPLYLLIARA